MSRTIEQLRADLDAIDSAIARAELEVRYAERTVKYRSVDEMLKARAHIAGLIAQNTASGRRGASSRYNFTTGRGF